MRLLAARMTASRWASRRMPARIVVAIILTPSCAEAPTSVLATSPRTRRESATSDHPLA